MPLASVVDGKACILGCPGGERVSDGVVATQLLSLCLCICCEKITRSFWV